MFRTPLVTALFVVACVRSSSEICPNGTVCPDGTVCRTVTNNNPTAPAEEQLCVPPADVAACEGAAERMSCTTSRDAAGACYEGVCLPVFCGNLRVDDGEVCDDGNTTAGDRCSHNCRSDETCGNGYVDPVRLASDQTPLPNEACDDANPLSFDGCSSRCAVETAAWTPIVVGAISPGRSQASLVFDSARRRFVLFGGEIGSTPVNETWESDGSGWELRRPAIAPSARRGPALAYDARRRRVVLFGGAGFSDTWEWDGTSWMLREPPVSPPARAYAAMEYDAARGVVVMFGGLLSTAQPLDDMWEWNGETWTQNTTVPKPPGRTAASLVYDPVRARLVLAGGNPADANDRRTWEFDGAKWIEHAAAAPLNDLDVMAFDAVSRRVIAYDNDDLTTLAWDGTTWANLNASVPIEPEREYAAMASDPATGRLLLVGGAGATAQYGDTWRWTGTEWSLVPTPAPEPTSGAAVARDPLRRRLIVFGGQLDTFPTADTWELVGTGWRFHPPGPDGPDPRTDAAMAFDAARDVLVLFGGQASAAAFLGDTWLRTETPTGPVWTLAFTPPGLTPRGGAAMAYDSVRDVIVLFGGRDSTTSLDETWEWDGTTWKLESPASKPPARYGHQLAFDAENKRVVMCGGVTGSGASAVLYQDCWQWDSITWSKIDAPDGPPPRDGHGLAWHPVRREIVLFGGDVQRQSTPANDTWQLQYGVDNSYAWRSVSTTTQPDPRAEHVFETHGDGGDMILFGGARGASRLFPQTGTFSDVWRFEYRTAGPYEACATEVDHDRDGRAGCDDRDCWARCTPLCEPHVVLGDCRLDQPRCGDGVCAPERENCRNCSQDCLCEPVCGDFYCDIGETQAMCPGDCTPPSP